MADQPEFGLGKRKTSSPTVCFFASVYEYWTKLQLPHPRSMAGYGITGRAPLSHSLRETPSLSVGPAISHALDTSWRTTAVAMNRFSTLCTGRRWLTVKGTSFVTA